MEFLSACNQMAEEVEESIRDLIGTPEGGRTVRMGADLTPTKLIDQRAEDCIEKGAAAARKMIPEIKKKLALS